MAFDKQTEKAFLTLALAMALTAFPVIATMNFDCNGKAFYCVNSTHFKICVDFGGVSKTVDDFLIACPPSTVCTENNYFECEYPISTTSATLPVQSDVTNELTEKTTPWVLFEETTFVPVNNHEKSIEFVNQTTISIETVSKAEVNETTDKMNMPVNEVILDNNKYILHNTTSSESANNNPKPIDLIFHSEISTTAAIDVITDSSSAITTGATTVDYSHTESEISNDSLNTIVTTPANKVNTENLTTAKIISPAIINYLKTESLSSERSYSSDLTKTVITTPSNNVENESIISTTPFLYPVYDGDLSSNSSMVEVTNTYKVTESETPIDLVKPDITASVTNLENVESNTESLESHTTSQNIVKESSISNVTMNDSYIKSTQQDTAETVTDANEFFTNDEIKTPVSMLKGSSIYNTNIIINRPDDFSTNFVTKAGTNQMELDSTTDINVALNYTADGFSLKKLNPYHVTIQTSTKTSLNLPTPNANELDLTKSYNMVNTNTNNKIMSITLSPLTISENQAVSESIFKSSTDEISASTDFHVEIGEDNQLNNTTETNINALTTVTTIVDDFYTHIGINSSLVGANYLFVQSQQVIVDKDKNFQKTTTTTVDSFFTDIKENTKTQVGIGDLPRQIKKNMTETDINFLTTTPTTPINVDYLNIINNTSQVLINTLFTQSQQNTTKTSMNFITTAKPTVSDFYTDIAKNTAQFGVIDILMRSQQNMREIDENFLTTTTTNVDETDSKIANNTSQVGVNASFTEDRTEKNMNFLITSMPNEDNFNRNIINYTTEAGVIDLLTRSQRNMTETLVNYLKTTTPNVDKFYSNITNNTSHAVDNALLLQNQQNMTEINMNFSPSTISTEDNFYTNIDTSQADQENITETDVHFLTTTPTNVDYLNITTNTFQPWINTLFTQSQQNMTETDVNIITTKPTVGDFPKDIINNISQIRIIDTLNHSQQNMIEKNVNFPTTTITNVDDFSNIAMNTSQNGVNAFFTESEQNMTEAADINSLTAITHTVQHDLYSNILKNTSRVEVNNESFMQSRQNITEPDKNFLTTTATVEDFYANIVQNTSNLGVNDLTIHDNVASDLPNADFSSKTDRHDDPYHSTSAFNIVLKDIEDLSDTFQTENTIYKLGNKDFDIGLTITTESYYEENTEKSTNANKVFTNLVKKINNDTSQGESSTDKYLIDKITAPLSPHVDFISPNKTNAYSDNFEFTTAINIPLNATAEFPMKATNALPSTKINDIYPINKNILINPNTTDIYKANVAFPSFSTNNIQYHSTTAMEISADRFNSDVTIKNDYEDIINFLVQQNDSKSTAEIFPSTLKHDIDTVEPTTNVPDTIVKPDIYGKIAQTDMEFIKTHELLDPVFSSTTTTEEIAILDNSITEFTRNESDTFNAQIIAEYQRNRVSSPVDDDKNIANRDKNDNNAKTNTKVTWKSESDTLNNIFQDMLTSKVTLAEITKSEIRSTVFQSQPNNENDSDYKNTFTKHAYTTDGTDINTNFREMDISILTLRNVTEPLSNKIETDRVSSGILYKNINSYSSTESLNNIKIYKTEDITESPTSVLNNLDKPEIMTFNDMKNITFTVTDKKGNFKTNRSSTSTKISDEFSTTSENLITRPINIIHVISSSSDKNVNNIKSILQKNVTELPFTSLKVKFDVTEKTIPFIPDLVHEKNINGSNTLKPSPQLRETISHNNSKLENNMKKTTNENTSDVTKVSKMLLEMAKINTTKNVVNNTKNETTSSILRTNSQLINNVDLAAGGTFLKISQVLSASSNLENKTSRIGPTNWDLKSSGLNILDKIEKTVPLSVYNMKNLSLSANASMQMHTKKQMDLVLNLDNFTTHYNKSVSALNSEKNLLNLFNNTSHVTNLSKVNNDSLNNLLSKERNQAGLLNQTEFRNSSNGASNVFNTSNPKSILIKQADDRTEYDKKNSYDNGLHKTVNIFNASKKLSTNNLTLKDPMQLIKDIRIEQTTKTALDLANKKVLKDYEITKSNFSCKNRLRGKYSDKNDCQNFYICIGRNDPIYGKCPNNTVFSEISKQCTRNLSHCIRNNQFKCTSSGRYIDIFSDHFYYICVPKAEGYLRFKLKCQKGYHLDKMKLQCILDSYNGSTSSDDSSKNDSEKSTAESKSKERKVSKHRTEDFECKKEGKFEYPDDCRKYYVCTRNGKSGFKRKIKKCDSDEVFNSKKRKCVDDDSYECKL